jgi:hypothetical protein
LSCAKKRYYLRYELDEYFSQLANEIDIKAESLLNDFKSFLTEQQINKINEKREKFLSEIK